MEVLSVLLVGSIVTYLMYQNISKVTSKLESEKGGSFEAYARFASKITDHIRRVKNDLDKDIDSSYPRFTPLESCNTEKTVQELLDLIRRTAFFETVMAKRKTPKEVEASLGEILGQLDEIIKKSCVNGEELAEEVKESLYKEYQKIHSS
jgi:valyl-tRNA synthetase